MIRTTTIHKHKTIPRKIEELASVDVNADGDEEDGDEAKEDDSVD